MGITENGSATSRELGRPHPEERACASGSPKSKGRARVSKDEDGGPHASRRIAAHLGYGSACARVRPMLLSMRATVRGAFWPNEATWKNQPAAVGNDRWFVLPVSGLLFTGSRATSTCRAAAARFAAHR